MDRLIDLLRRQASTTHRHVVPVKNLADRPPLDTEPGTQLIHRCPTLISSDKFLDLIGAESAGPPGFGPIGGRRAGCGGVRKLPPQGLQGFYLRFRVIVSSFKVHRSSRSGPV
jgi:hypothetical protein